MLNKILEHKKRELSLKKEILPLSELIEQAKQVQELPSLDQAFHDNAETQIIAEIKFASPSHGSFSKRANHLELAATYLKHGATAISILTDSKFFHGDLTYLAQVRFEFPNAFILRKDFIIDEYQVYESKLAGANGLLLIADCLEDELLASLLKLTRELNMEALVECHSKESFQRAHQFNAKLIGVNNRDLTTMQISLDHSRNLAGLLESEKIYIAESGIEKRAEIEELQSLGYQGFLIGSALMSAEDSGETLQNLRGRCS